MKRSCAWFILLLLPALGRTIDLADVPVRSLQGERVTTAAVVADGVIHVASYETAGRLGHLRAFTLSGGRSVRLWDAAEWVPLPGAAQPPPTPPDVESLSPRFSEDAGERLLFTNLDAAAGFRLLSFDARAAYLLQPLLGAATVAEAAALINTARGRVGASAIDPAGSGDSANRLGAISRSSPALVGGSSLAVAAADRDRLLYAGGEDGLLHAILAGRRQSGGPGHDPAAPGCGRELWAYLPGSLLADLKDQPPAGSGLPPAVHVDGAPAVSDLFIDSDGDGRREWRTILVGTASARLRNRGVVFALDVTDPRAPRLLWETSLPGVGAGPSRGAALGMTAGGSDPEARVFLTFASAERLAPEGDPAPLTGSYGALACALDLRDGRLLWRFAMPCPGAAANFLEAPSLPSLLTAADGGVDGVVFGDLAGRLWLLDPGNGLPRGGGPLWQTPGGVDEPIGSGLAVRNRLVLFGSGGVEHADAERSYAVYAVEILAGGARLLWTQPLAPEERLWGAPTFDRFGRSYLGVGTGADDAGGRLLVVAADGTLAGSAALAGAPHAGAVVVAGAVVTVSRTGQVEQHGELLQGPAASGTHPGRVRVLSWRVR